MDFCEWASDNSTVLIKDRYLNDDDGDGSNGRLRGWGPLSRSLINDIGKRTLHPRKSRRTDHTLYSQKSYHSFASPP